MEITNTEKGKLYAFHWRRIKIAMSYEFYLEAISICYDFLEDCTRSILKARSSSKALDTMFIKTKLKKIGNIITQRKQILARYVTVQDIEETINWLDSRNDLIHRMMKNPRSSEDSKMVAENGVLIARKFMDISTKFRRALAKAEAKNGGTL